MGNKRTPNEWNPNNHKFYSKQFKIEIETFLKCLKRNHQKTGIKIPKFVIFEIIKKINWSPNFIFNFCHYLKDYFLKIIIILLSKVHFKLKITGKDQKK